MVFLWMGNQQNVEFLIDDVYISITRSVTKGTFIPGVYNLKMWEAFASLNYQIGIANINEKFKKYIGLTIEYFLWFKI